MGFKDILVHVDNFENSPARLRTAIKLAQNFNARLTGLYVIFKPKFPAYAQAGISAETLENEAKLAKQQVKEAEKDFRAATGKNGLQCEWRVEEGITAEIFSQQARYHDLAVVGQGHPDSYVFTGDREMPDHMILSCGRPVLVIPYVGDFETIGKHVIVAWDASPIAAGAVHDSLPFLKAAKSVTVLVVNPKGGDYETGELPGADISAHLARHGVNVEADHMQSDLDPGNMLLSRAADTGADLIVMGAYGHARWTEIVFGGVTNHFLSHMTVPVLMSH